MTTINASNQSADLCDCTIQKGPAEECDRVFLFNRLMEEMNVAEFAPDQSPDGSRPLEEILSVLCRKKTHPFSKASPQTLLLF